ncbi:Stress response protein nst1 [Coemansia sp. RSA 2050]|nr:Stress response protein nst1 [Coemansia sp. RSA 2050]
MDSASSRLQAGPSNGKPSGTKSGDARWKSTPSMRSAAAAAAAASAAATVSIASQGSASTATPAVYGPEPPPSMARSKAAAGTLEPLSFDLKNISMLLHGERRGDMSRSECMRQTEAELQRLFHSRLVEIMATNGYDDGGFTELDVANVMVANGLMNTPADDPLVALATELKSEMSSIFHSNMRRMSNNVIDPEFLAGIASDPFVIDSIIDLSWGRVRGGDSSDAAPPFEGIAKVLQNFSLPEGFSYPGCGEHEDTDSNGEYEDDKVPPCEAPHIPPTVNASSSLQASKGDRGGGKADNKGKDVAAPAQRAPSLPVPEPALAPAAAPALGSVDAATPKATRGQRRRMRKSMYRAVTEPNGNHASELPPVSDANPSVPLSGDAAATAAAAAATIATSGGLTGETIAPTDQIHGLNSEGLPAGFPAMGPPSLPDACFPSTELTLDKMLGVGPTQQTPVRIPAADGGSKVDIESVNPTTSAPPVAIPVASTPTANRAIANAPATSGSKRAVESTKTLWSSDAIEEQRRVREFWLSLGAAERQSLIGAEKKVVQARVREHQNFSCSCNVCSRKREAIENELNCLYDSYHEELKENVRKANMRSLIRAAEKKARSIIESSIGAFAKSLISKAAIDSQNCTKDVLCKNIIEHLRAGKTVEAPANCPEFESLNELEAAVYTAAMSASDGVLTKIASVVRYLDQGSSYSKAIEDAGLLFKSSDKELATIRKAAVAIKEWTDGSSAYRREFGTEPFLSDEEGDEDVVNNNDLFYTENMLDSIDTFPTDGKKFFDMMEQLAEYRMRREDAFLDVLEEAVAADDDSAAHENGGGSNAATHAWNRKPLRQSRSQRRCPDCQGDIGEGESEDRQNYSDSEYHVARYAGTKRPRSESRGGDRAKVQFDDVSIEYVNNPNDALSKGKAGFDGGMGPSYDDEEDDDDDGYEDEDDENDDDEDDDDLDDDDDDIDDTDDDYDDLDPENAERDAEEGRKVFQLFAARLFEQRVINLYREKVARDRQQNLIKELEEEEKRMEAKEKRKQKKKQREKEKKRHIQQQKEEERRAKEEQERAEKEQRRIAQQKRVEEQLNKKREEESRAKKAMEERNRKILEQADRRLAKEREERMRAEEQRLEKEAREREERNRRQRPQTTQAPAPALASEPIAAPATPVSPKPAPKPTADPPSVVVSPPALAKVQSAQLPAPPTSTPSVAARSPLALFAAGSASDTIFASSPGTPLLDNAMLPTVNRSSPGFMASRPSLPMIHPAELPAASPEAFDFAPSRVRANSGSSIRHPAPVPIPPFMTVARTSSSPPSAVPSEFDAEIMSIVGRVMGSCTLQDDLTGGAEWRTEPADSYMDSPRAMHPQPSHTAAFGLSDPLGPLSDLSVRRNSVPVNRPGREGGFDANSGGNRQSTSSSLTGGMEGVYSAYCALEKFSRDKRTPSAAGLGQDMFGGSYSAAEIAQMHGSMRESSVWSICASYAQANPNKCRLNHAERSIALARNLSGVPPIAPAVLDVQRLTSPASPHFAETPRSTPPIQLPVIAEDRVGGSGLSQSQTGGGSPSMVGLSARSQPRSPLLQPRQAAPPMALPMMPQFGPPTQSPVGMSYSPVAHVSPSSLFFGPIATHGGSGSMPIRVPAPPFSLPPFQQSPLGASSLGHAHLADGRGMTMLPPQPPMSMSFSHQLQMRPSNSPWPHAKLGGSDAVALGELLIAPVRAAMQQTHQYTDKFDERETAFENKYIREQEMKKIKALQDELEKTKKQVGELEAKINEHHREAASKSQKK